jgi:hypothetical protein
LGLAASRRTQPPGLRLIGITFVRRISKPASPQVGENGASQINDIAPCMPKDRCDDDPLDLNLVSRLGRD